jgi:hypothetical protein
MSIICTFQFHNSEMMSIIDTFQFYTSEMMSINTNISLIEFQEVGGGGRRVMIIFKSNSTWKRLRKRIFTSFHITLRTTKLFHVNNTVCTLSINFHRFTLHIFYATSKQAIFIHSTVRVNSYEKKIYIRYRDFYN